MSVCLCMLCMCVCICVCMCVCMCVCACVYVFDINAPQRCLEAPPSSRCRNQIRKWTRRHGCTPWRAKVCQDNLSGCRHSCNHRNFLSVFGKHMTRNQNWIKRNTGNTTVGLVFKHHLIENIMTRCTPISITNTTYMTKQSSVAVLRPPIESQAPPSTWPWPIWGHVCPTNVLFMFDNV